MGWPFYANTLYVVSTMLAGSVRIVHIIYLINFTVTQTYQFDSWFDFCSPKLIVLIAMAILNTKGTWRTFKPLASTESFLLWAKASRVRIRCGDTVVIKVRKSYWKTV